MSMPEYQLDENEAVQISALVEDVRKESLDPTRSAFYDNVGDFSDRLPAGLLSVLEEFRDKEPAEALVVHGFPVEEKNVALTPDHWREGRAVPSTAPHEIMLALCGQVLGEPFTWATLQQGSLVQNILPIAGDEQRQNGYGSDALLEFHTEDAFHPDRCNFLLLFGVRNPDRVATVLSSVCDIELSTEDRRILSEPRYQIRPDTEHIRQLEALWSDHPALSLARRMSESPELTAALFGDPENPYLRIDPPFMDVAKEEDHAARSALDTLVAELERHQKSVALGSGSLLAVNNYLAVHGRKSFTARYDGNDRWLKKLTVSRKLRSSSLRDTAESRVLF